jgi:hypothetical protein
LEDLNTHSGSDHAARDIYDMDRDTGHPKTWSVAV